MEKTKPKIIKETKCSCSACGNIWFYGKQEAAQSCGESMENCGKSASCCSGCGPAAFIPDKKPLDLGKCPKCGSRAIKKEEITHEL
ncbi:hypothetical protein HYV44_01665 [Candidatus Microgenomates bacterium]|nr:hypothetical protein [Candidatus Microgenomates bacterium]